MAHKLVKDFDDKTWREFVAYCKLKNVKVNEELENILNKHLNKNFKKLLK